MNSGRVLGLIPHAMLEESREGRLGKTDINLQDESVILYAKDGLNYEEYQDFEETASSSRNWIRVPIDTAIGEDQELSFAYSFKYGLIAYPVRLQHTSNLYKYSMAILSVPEPISRISTNPNYRREHAQ